MTRHRRTHWLLCVAACATASCGKPAPLPATRSQAAASVAPTSLEAPRPSPAKPPPVSAPQRPESKPPVFSIERDETDAPALDLSTPVGGCTLHLTLEKERMWWRAERVLDDSSVDCRVLAPEHRAGWAALAREANRLGRLPERLAIVVDFHADLPGIERWFRYQAASSELQKRARNRDNAEYVRTLAAELPGSGALFRYQELLQAMGLRIEKVLLEKVEVRAAGDWRKDLPESETWALPASSRLALPFLTWLELRRAGDDASGP
ncbi:MAG: hypothetical protein JW940_25975 [Polyangiaceae bacterium]|nr:hypothetical protein [Polyangiaceae bacterium]